MASSDSLPGLSSLVRSLLGPERDLYGLLLVYGLAVSALTLAVPLSVQVLISTVANTALLQSVLVLSAILFVLLLLSGLFVAAQTYVMELFERRFFARVVSAVSLRLIYARSAFMETINRDELVNRYFDIMTVQKSLPALLTGGLSLLLQAVVGITLTSFYHPAFLLFNLLLILVCYLVYRVLDSAAARTAVAMSAAKYDCAKWLEDLSRSNSFFKATRTTEWALERTVRLRDAYLARHRSHFHFAFAQVVGYLAIYAGASAALLGVGGWLVIEGQLTVGQLVAAELILSAIFASLTRLGYYLELYYELYAALSKLSQLFSMPVEDIRGDHTLDDWRGGVRCKDVHLALPGGPWQLDFELPAGAKVAVLARSHSQIKAFTDLLLGHRRPDRGSVLLDGHEVSEADPLTLRDLVHVIDGTTLPECSVAEFLEIAAPGVTRARMREVVEIVGLGHEVHALPDGLDQVLTPYGHPLSFAGMVKLKIAHALLAQPRMLVLTPLFDSVSLAPRSSILRHLASLPALTVLCFSTRREVDQFDQFLLWDFDHLEQLPDAAELERRAALAARASSAESTPW